MTFAKSLSGVIFTTRQSTTAYRRWVSTIAKRLGMTTSAYLERAARGEKYCNKCRQWQPVQEFRKDGRRTDGRHSSCRSCSNDDTQARIAERRAEKAAFARKASPVATTPPVDPRALCRAARADKARQARFAEEDRKIRQTIERADRIEAQKSRRITVGKGNPSRVATRGGL